MNLFKFMPFLFSKGTYRLSVKYTYSLVALMFLLSNLLYAQSPNPANIIASDGEAEDNFGNSISVSGDYMVVGADGDDDEGAESGSIYIYENDGSGNWGSEQKITASDGSANSNFGVSVSISGDFLVVGADGDDGGYGFFSGAIYVYKKDGSGIWGSEQKIKAYDGIANDFFGRSVAISGDYIVVGVEGSDDNGSESGSIYIYKNDGAGNWGFEQKLTPPAVAANDFFGCSVSISGDFLVAGARLDDDNGSASGSAYIGKKNNAGTWVGIQKLTPSEGAPISSSEAAPTTSLSPEILTEPP